MSKVAIIAGYNKSWTSLYVAEELRLRNIKPSLIIISYPFTKNRLIKYSHETVNYFFNVQQISERIIVDIPVKVINKIKGIRVFPSPQTVSLTVVGGINQIAKIKPIDISVIVDFNLWQLEKNFYAPKIKVPFEILNWKDLSPRTIELGVARESK